MNMFLNEGKFNLRIRITLFICVFVENNYMSSLRTTTCDALIVPSGYCNWILYISEAILSLGFISITITDNVTVESV